MSWRSTDVFIVGGGPAGLAAAIALREKGLRVTLADAALPPIDKACGEGLMPDSLHALSLLGVNLDPREGAVFHGIKFIGDGNSVSADFPKGPGLGLRRLALHTAMTQHATGLGVEFLWGTPVRGLVAGGVLLGDCAVECNWIIGADGQNSRVRKWAGLGRAHERERRFALRRHFSVRPWSRYVETYWSDRGQACVSGVSEREICVALISRSRWSSFQGGLSYFPELAARIGASAAASTVRGALSVTCRLRRVLKGNVALVGEASGSVDAITGDGMGIAFKQARVLADAISRKDLAIYQREHAAIARRPSFMGRAMLLMDKSSWLRRRALTAFAVRPGLFERLLSFHVGESGAEGFFALGWQMLINNNFAQESESACSKLLGH